MSARHIGLIFLLLLGVPPQARADDAVAKETIQLDGRERTYYFYAPASAKSPAPLIVLLHGSGDNGLFMLEKWKDVAAREGIVILAPDSLHTNVGWDLRTDGPDYIHELIKVIAADHAIDFRRLYLFGQSGGAVYALSLGMLESEYFAAIAFHAGGWRHTAEYRVMDYAKRKIPVSMWVGDRDEFFSLSSVQNTQRILSDARFPVELNIMKGRVHSYLDVPPDFNDTVWASLKRYALSDIPKFAPYRYGAAAPD